MAHPLIQKIIDSTNEWGGFSHQNSVLELASMTLEAKVAGLDISPLKPVWELQRDATRKSPGVFIRSPDSTMSNSHDNLMGIAVLSYLFDNGETAREILDQGTTFGLWLTGPNEHGKWIDSEWFSLLRPEYRGIVKLAAGRKLNIIEKLFLSISLDFNKVWNTKRVKLLFLRLAGLEFSASRRYEQELGDKYKGRYNNDPIYVALWDINKGSYDF